MKLHSVTARGLFRSYKRAKLGFGLAWVFFITVVGSCVSIRESQKQIPIPQQSFLPTSTPVEFKVPSIHSKLSSSNIVAGSIALVTIEVSETRDVSVSGRFEGSSLPFYSNEEKSEKIFQSVLAIPYERKPGPAFLTIYVKSGLQTTNLKIPFNVIEGTYPSEILHVNGRRVNPRNKKDLIQIKHDQENVSKVYARITLKKFWNGPFEYPIHSIITSPFGSKRIYNGRLKNFHPGLDLKAQIGTPVFAAAPGIVALANPLFYTGNTVIIDHGYGVVTLYAHLSRIKVKTGQLLARHQLIGLSGKTGRVNGPHLHWQAVVDGIKVNPLGLVKVLK